MSVFSAEIYPSSILPQFHQSFITVLLKIDGFYFSGHMNFEISGIKLFNNSIYKDNMKLLNMYSERW